MLSEIQFIQDLKQFNEDHYIQLLITIVLILSYLISGAVMRKVIKRHAATHSIDRSRVLYTRKLTDRSLAFFMFILIALVWEVSFQGLSIYFASILTVVGVAFFAHWSLLSNVTASLILFFSMPYRIGSKIKVLDGDNSVEGIIVNISLFYIQIENDSKEVFSYPNNLILQKPVKRLS